jgi:iron:rusticyanin reductase
MSPYPTPQIIKFSVIATDASRHSLYNRIQVDDMYKTFLKLLLPISGLLLSLAITPEAQAVPSFARQTGMSCSSCHTAFPQLTSFGRQFKMEGYTLTDTHELKSEGVDIGLGAPLSMMIQATLSKLKKEPDANTSGTQVRLPAQLSIFYAGRVTENIGAFVQITAEDGAGFSQDNTDIRFADNGKLGGNDVIYGVTLNNNPTVQDPWNSTPVWGFPWFEAGYGYANPGSMIEAVGGAVTGLTAYGFWNQHIYTEAGIYKASNAGGNTDTSTEPFNVIKNSAPYWRLAYTADAGNMNWEVGAFGGHATLPGDEVLTDTALDTQLQWQLEGNQSLTFDANYIRESQSNSQHLNTMKADLTWYTNQTWGVTAGYRGASSSANAINEADASSTGDLGSKSYQLQLNYTPWLNTRFALQYTAYNKLNGTTSGASDSNQTMLGGWFLF